MSKQSLKWYWDKIAKSFRKLENKGVKNWFSVYVETRTKELLLDQLNKTIKFEDNSRILDLGCGTGKITRLFQDIKKNLDILGVDISLEMLQISRAHLFKRGNNDTKFCLGNIIQLPFTDYSFDVVNSTTVLHHVIDDVSWRKAIQEITRVTKLDKFIVIYGIAPFIAPIKRTPTCIVKTLNEHVKAFALCGAKLLSWRGTDVSFPLTLIGSHNYTKSFNETVYYYYDSKRWKLVSLLSKIITNIAKILDYKFTATKLGLLSLHKILIFQRIR